MKNKTGFTLTEILFAVMIVALIGVALASLTTAASREGGVGRSKVMLRNNMSRALRQLRQDIHDSSRVLYARGPIDAVADNTMIPLLVLGQNVRVDGNAMPGTTAHYIRYCFLPGSVTTTASGSHVEPWSSSGDVPTGARDEGIIYRQEFEDAAELFPENDINPNCDAANPAEIFLEHVKFIPVVVGEHKYPVPLFSVDGVGGKYSIKEDIGGNLGSTLLVNLILELPTSPVVNDVTEETFMLPNGFADGRN